MSKIDLFLQEAQCSDYEIAVFKYAITAFMYDFTKILLMGIFFGKIGMITEYLFAMFLLTLLRTNMGGLHFKTYTGCFVFSFIFIFSPVVFLPLIQFNKLIMLPILLICIIITDYIGPIASNNRHMKADEKVINKCKRNYETTIFFYGLLVFIIPQNTYTYIGFWVIILQSLQLVIAHIIKARRYRDGQISINTFD